MHDESHTPVLSDVFARVDLLTVPARLELSELLATPAGIPALTADQVAALPLPSTEAGRRDLPTAIEQGLGPGGLGELRHLTLAEVVPLVVGCPGGPAGAGAPTRLCAILERAQRTTWSSLAGVTMEEMSGWTGFGPAALATLTAAAVRASLAATTPPAGAGETPAEPGSPSLGLLLRHDDSAGGTLRLTLEAYASGEAPVDVAAAARNLLAAASCAADPHLALLDRIWTAAGHHRARAVLAHRCLTLDQRLPVGEVAAALEVSQNRVAQIVARAGELARAAALTEEGALGALVGNLGARLGTACRLGAVDEALGALGLPGRSDPRSALLVWLAGPYLPVKGHAGWVATDPATLLADTKRLLSNDGGVHQPDHLSADLQAAGIAPHDIDAWLAQQPALAMVDGLMVTLTGSPADVAERLLSATGKAMTAAELAALAPHGHTAQILDQRLRRDPRFVRVDRQRFEPTEWGSTAYAEPAPPPPTELFPRTGRSQLRVEVDAASLRGAAEPVPPQVVEALGLPCGGRRTFTTRFGPITLSYKATEPTRGSVRPIALAAGATEGDVLVIDFDAATGDASVELLVAASSAAS